MPAGTVPTRMGRQSTQSRAHHPTLAHLRAALRVTRITIGFIATTLGSVFIPAAVFLFSRGVPGECGGDAPACPAEAVAAWTLAVIGVMVLCAGAAIAGVAGFSTSSIFLMALALASAGSCAAVLLSRFVADPITTTIWPTVGFAAFFGLAALGCGSAGIRSAARPDAHQRTDPDASVERAVS